MADPVQTPLFSITDEAHNSRKIVPRGSGIYLVADLGTLLHQMLKMASNTGKLQISQRQRIRHAMENHLIIFPREHYEQ